MTEIKLLKCQLCSKGIASNALSCPNCGNVFENQNKLEQKTVITGVDIPFIDLAILILKIFAILFIPFMIIRIVLSL